MRVARDVRFDLQSEAAVEEHRSLHVQLVGLVDQVEATSSGRINVIANGSAGRGGRRGRERRRTSRKRRRLRQREALRVCGGEDGVVELC